MGCKGGACRNVRIHSTSISAYTTLICVYRKDVRLPAGFQRAMAAEAESSREARAKVDRKYGNL